MKKTLSDKQFIENMTRQDELLDHEDNCGLCFHQQCMANAAREIVESGNLKDVIKRWDVLAKKLWQEGKYYQLYLEEQKAGREPNKAFEEKGWEK